MSSAVIIGSVTSPRNGKRYDVKWNSYSKDAYVAYAGWALVGNAASAEEALAKALSWLAANT